MKIAIIDYKAGNIKSVEAALLRLGCQAFLTKEPQEIKSADKVVFPGVGNAGAAMQAIKNFGLDKVIPELKQPVLGICLGMQLMCSFSEEENTDGLKIFSAQVKRFVPKDAEKIPHMGWNEIFNLKTPLFEGIKDKSFVYFVHSYAVETFENTSAECFYINNFSASIAKDNFFGVQFHPEKSGQIGLKILENFVIL